MRGTGLAARTIVCLAAALALLLLAPMSVPAQTEGPRVALVITGDGPEAAANFAAMQRLLGPDGLGYDLIPAPAASRDDLLTGKGGFLARLSPGAIAVIYYAGYGVRANGVDYLLPAGARPASAADLSSMGYDLDNLVKGARDKGADVVVLLDACRRKDELEALGVQCLGGAVRNRDHVYVLAAGATLKPGGGDGASPFTAQLAKQLQRGRTIRQVFVAVRNAQGMDAVVDLPITSDDRVMAPGQAPAPVAEAPPPPTKPGSLGVLPASEMPPPPPPAALSKDELEKRYTELTNTIAVTNGMYDDGDTETAISRLPPLLDEARAIQEADPEHPGIHRDLGRLAMMRGDYRTAVTEFEQERANRAPDDTSGYIRFLKLLLGTAYLRDGRLEPAIEALKAAEFDPMGGESSARNAARRAARLGEAYRRLNQPVEAEAALVDANRFFPNIDNAAAHMQLAHLYQERRDYELAQREARTAARYREDRNGGAPLAEAYIVMGRAQWGLNGADEAAAWKYLDQALAADPSSGAATAVKGLAPKVISPDFSARPPLTIKLEDVESRAMTCYETAPEREAYLIGDVNREIDRLTGYITAINTYLSSLSRLDMDYQSRGYNFHDSIIAEINAWGPRSYVAEQRILVLRTTWYSHVTGTTLVPCKGKIPAQLPLPAGYVREGAAPARQVAVARPPPAVSQPAPPPVQPPPPPVAAAPVPLAPAPVAPPVAVVEKPAPKPEPPKPEPPKSEPPKPAPPEPKPAAPEPKPPAPKPQPPPVQAAAPAPPKPRPKPAVAAAPPPKPAPPPAQTAPTMANLADSKPPPEAPPPAPPRVATAKEKAQAAAQLQKGLALQAQGQFPQAMGLINDAIRLDPTAEAWNALGEIYDKTQPDRADLALGAFENALRLNSRLVAPYVNRARINSRANNWAQALNDLDAALTINPGSGEARFLRADILLSRGNVADVSAVVSDLTAALRAFPQWPEARKRLGDAYFLQRDYLRALPEYKLAVDARPQWTEVLYAHGRSSYLAGRNEPRFLDDAVNDMRQLLAKGPDYGGYCTVGLSYFLRAGPLTGQAKVDDLQLANEAFAQANRMRPNTNASFRYDKSTLFLTSAKGNVKGGFMGGLAKGGAGLLTSTLGRMLPGKETLDPLKACDDP